MFNHYPPPEESTECTKTIYLPRAGKEIVRGVERTRTRLGCPHAAATNQLEGPRGPLPPATAWRGAGLLPPTRGLLVPAAAFTNRERHSKIQTTYSFSLPPSPPLRGVSPRSRGRNFFSCHLTVLKRCADQQSDIKKEQVKKLLHLL